mmetsp:Transcript_68897/g.175064  ORF Transcript_68897/g.175064 Transcript_68897/m.175064 type:complete len:276 (+) Transcript_68897:941-1768(+)
MQKSHRPIQADVQHLPRHLPVLHGLIALGLRIEAGLQQLQVDITQLVQEEAVRGRGRGRELIVLHGLVGLVRADAQPREDPPILPGKGRAQAQRAAELEVLAEVGEAEASGVPDLVAEVPVAHHTVNVQIHILALRGVCQETKPQSIRTALRDAVGVVCGLTLLGLLDLLLGQVALVELQVQLFELDALDDLNGVNDVAQALGHLAAVRVADHGVQVNGLEGQLARQADRHHDHACHPEEEDVVAGLQERGREEGLEVVVTLGVGPAEDREGEQA